MSHCAADGTSRSPDIKPEREDIYQFNEIRYEQTTRNTSIKSLPVPGLTNIEPRLQLDKPQTKAKPNNKHELNLSKSEKSCHNSQHTSIQLCAGVTRDTSKLPMIRTRTAFTDLQLLELENYFKTNKFLTMEDSHLLTKRLLLSKKKIRIWLQNRRAKEIRENKLGIQKQKINSSEFVPMEMSYFCPEEIKHTTSPTTETTEESVLYNYVW